MKKVIQATTAIAMLAASSMADIAETFTKANESPFTGTADLTWVGDIGSMTISNNALNHAVNESTARVILTDMGTGYALGRSWSAKLDNYVDNNLTVNAAQWGGLILASDSTTVANVVAGSMNGFRLIWNGGTTPDYLRLQRASGSGWSTVSEVSVAAGLNWNSGPVFTASVDAGGNFSYSDGVNSSTYAAGAITLGQYAGFIVADNSNGKGHLMDNFSVTTIPEPATLGIIASAAFGILFIRRRLSM